MLSALYPRTDEMPGPRRLAGGESSASTRTGDLITTRTWPLRFCPGQRLHSNGKSQSRARTRSSRCCLRLNGKRGISPGCRAPGRIPEKPSTNRRSRGPPPPAHTRLTGEPQNRKTVAAPFPYDKWRWAPILLKRHDGFDPRAVNSPREPLPRREPTPPARGQALAIIRKLTVRGPSGEQDHNMPPVRNYSQERAGHFDSMSRTRRGASGR